MMESLGFEEMRSCLLAALEQSPQTEDTALQQSVAAVAIARRLLPAPDPDSRRNHGLPQQYWGCYRDALWAFIVEGVVAIGKDSQNSAWPFLAVTEYGHRCLAAGEIVPHDTENYLASLATARPLDDTEKRFIPQALAAFLRNLPDASAVMLGCASEHLLIVLAQALADADSVSSETRNMWRQRIEKCPARELLRHLGQEMERRSDKNAPRSLPRHLAERRERTFMGIADMIRIARNDAGHPALDRAISRDDCFVHLKLFHSYRTWIAQAIDHL